MKFSFDYLRNRLKHDSFLKLFSDGMDRCGIIFRPYFIEYDEGRYKRFHSEKRNYDIQYLHSEEMCRLVKIPGRYVTKSELAARLDAGMCCIALKEHGELVAFTWVEFGAISFCGRDVRLQKHEVYLFDAWTMVTERGKRVAPTLRAGAYTLLRASGCTGFYSITEYVNRSALRYKRKMNVKPVELAIYFSVKGLFRKHLIIKRYK